MTILSPPRPAIVSAALDQARTWCAGHEIDQAPALRHAVAVTVVLGRYHAEIGPQVLAATLLHDAPEYAPAEVDLDQHLAWAYGPETRRIVREMERLQADMRPGNTHPAIDPADAVVVQAVAADKIVAIASMLRRARRSGDATAFWTRRQAFINVLGYFSAFRALAAGVCEADMIDHLTDLIALSRIATDLYQQRSTTHPQQAVL